MARKGKLYALLEASFLSLLFARIQLRPVLLSNWFVRLVLNNPAFLWNALGVPLAQRRAFLVRAPPLYFAQHIADSFE